MNIIWRNMIGDIVQVKPHHLPPARQIVKLIEPELNKKQKVFTISVGGESGSGKSTLSLAVEKILEEKGHNCFIFHMDDYFKLPPKDNHDRRLDAVKNVGPHEVKLNLLQQHINHAREGAKKLKKPLVHYRENRMREVIVELEKIDVVIVEGTYVTILDNIDCKVFMLRNYTDTYHARVERARDPIIPFNEKVLQVEHEIISNHRQLADIWVDKNYNVKRRK